MAGVAAAGRAAAANRMGLIRRGRSRRCSALRLCRLRGPLLGFWLGKEVLVAENGGKNQQHEGHRGAEIAATTAAAGTLRLQIGILNFGQRMLSYRSEGQAAGLPLFLW